jgi:Uma2 family endonuclease
MATDVRVRLDAGDNLISFRAGWDDYQSLIRAIGDQNVRLSFDGERVELMSPGQEHEDYKVLFERLVGALTAALKVPCKGMGSARWLRPEAERGLETDASFYLTTDKIAIARRRPKNPADYPIPDLSVEIDLRPSQVDRAGIYEALGGLEVWRFDGETVRIDRLGPDGRHSDAPESGWLGIRPEEIARLLTLDAEDDNDFSNQVVAWACGVLVPHRGKGNVP